MIKLKEKCVCHKESRVFLQKCLDLRVAPSNIKDELGEKLLSVMYCNGFVFMSVLYIYIYIKLKNPRRERVRAETRTCSTNSPSRSKSCVLSITPLHHPQKKMAQ